MNNYVKYIIWMIYGFQRKIFNKQIKQFKRSHTKQKQLVIYKSVTSSF